MAKIIKNTAIGVLLLTAVYFSLMYPSDMGDSVRDSIDRCFTVILPSMFIFICITSYISLSGFHSLLGRPFKFISEKVFRLPKEGFAIFLLSMISGYPAGIKLVKDGWEGGSISSRQSKVMSCFCCCGGPAFISGTAAAYLYPGSDAAVLVFASVVSANFITAFVMTRKLPRITASGSSHAELKGNVLIPAVRSACSALLQMCMMIAAFGGICCILRLSGVINYISDCTAVLLGVNSETVSSVIMTFLEISNIVTLPAMDISMFPVVTFLLSFGGICVVMQIAALADENFDLKLFIAARLFTAVSAAFISRFFIRFLDIDLACVRNVRAFSAADSSPVPSVLLFIMMIMTMGIMGKRELR